MGIPTVPMEAPVTLPPDLQVRTIHSRALPKRHNGSTSLELPLSWKNGHVAAWLGPHIKPFKESP